MPHTLSTAAKVAALVLSLGLDTFAVSVGLGLSGLERGQQIRFGISFALAEGIMPLIGFLVGRLVARAFGAIAAYVAIALLVAVGAYTVWEARKPEDPEYEAVSPARLIALALSVSLDELAVGFSFGLLRMPIVLAAALIAVQAFVLTIAGTTLGARIGEVTATRAERLSGIVLIALGVVLFMEQVLVG